MGKSDQMIRVIAALVIGGLYFSGQISGTIGLILGVVAIAFLLTGIIGFCPLYLPFGISTRKKQQ